MALGIPNIHVGSELHEFLIIPAQTASGAQFYIFDPTVQQYYPGYEHRYFLGTREQLEQFASSTDLMPPDYPNYRDIYLKDLRIRDNGGLTFENSQIPDDIKEMLAPRQVELLDGRRSMQQAQDEALDAQCTKLNPDQIVDRRAREAALLEQLAKESADVRQRIQQRTSAHAASGFSFRSLFRRRNPLESDGSGWARTKTND